MKHDHPKPVPYLETKNYIPVTIEATDTLEDSIFASAAGAYIRDVAHRPSVPDVEFEKIAKMAVHAAELFRRSEI